MRDEGRDNAIASGSCSVRMWGYLPAASPQRTPLLLPVPVPNTALNDPLKIVCNGGCGFGIAISGMQPDRTICSSSATACWKPLEKSPFIVNHGICRQKSNIARSQCLPRSQILVLSDFQYACSLRVSCKNLFRIRIIGLLKKLDCSKDALVSVRNLSIPEPISYFKTS